MLIQKKRSLKGLLDFFLCIHQYVIIKEKISYGTTDARQSLLFGTHVFQEDQFTYEIDHKACKKEL